MWEVQVRYQAKVFHQEIHTALKQVSISGDRISIPGDLPSRSYRKQSLTSLSAGDNPAPKLESRLDDIQNVSDKS